MQYLEFSRRNLFVYGMFNPLIRFISDPLICFVKFCAELYFDRLYRFAHDDGLILIRIYSYFSSLLFLFSSLFGIVLPMLFFVFAFFSIFKMFILKLFKNFDCFQISFHQIHFSAPLLLCINSHTIALSFYCHKYMLTKARFFVQ